MIIKFKIRTLDSQNEEFEVDDQLTVRDLKEFIKERMGIDPALQRLIFAGKVLNEEFKLDQLDINGMVVHLVTRLPPSPEDLQNASDLAGSQRRPARPSRLRSIPFNMSDTIARMTNLKRLIREFETSMIELNDQVCGHHPGNIFPMPSPTGSEEYNTNLEAEEPVEPNAHSDHINITGAAEEIVGDPNLENSNLEAEEPVEPNADSDHIDITGAAEEIVGDPNLESNDNLDADMLSDNADQSPFTPEITDETTHYQLSLYFSSLMNNLSQLQSEFAPYVRVHSQIVQNFNHDFHYTEVERQHSQKTLDLVIKQMHTLAHVFHTASDILVLLRATGSQLTSLHSFPMRPQMPLQTQINVSQMPSRLTNDQSTPNLSATQYSSQTEAASPQAGPSRAPDQITYQVEIETRVPIAFAVDNGLIGNLAQNEGQNLDAATRGNLQQGLENLLREITQNGVQAGLEVFSLQNAARLFESNGVGPNISGHQNVDSNQSPQAPIQATGPATNQGGGPDTSSSQAERVPVTQMRATATTPSQATATTPNQATATTPNQATATTPSQATATTPSQATAATPSQATATTPNQPIPNHLTQAHTVPRMRSAVIRGMLLPENAQLNHFVRTTEEYDSYLPCESCFVRNTRPWRSALGELFTQLQMRNRETAQNFINITQVAENFTPDTINIIQNFLNQAPATTASYFIALMTCLARQYFTPEVMEPLGDLPGMIPSEFPRVYALLREALSQIIDIEEPASREQAENVVNHLIVKHADLLNCLNSDEFIDREFDFTLSITALLHDRMPAVLACMLNRIEIQTQVRRFYSIFGQLFIDMGVLITLMCGPSRLRNIHSICETVLDAYVNYFPRDIRYDVITFCLEIFHYYRRLYNGQQESIMFGVEHYLRPFAGAAPENLQRIEEEGPISHSSPLEGFSLDTSETTPVVQSSFCGNILDSSFEFSPETTRPSTSNTPPLSVVNKKGFKDSREKSKQLVAKVLELSAAKRKQSLTSKTTSNLINPQNLMDRLFSPAQNLMSPETLQSPRNNSTTTVTTPQDSNTLRQRESRRISVTPRPGVSNVTPGPPQTPDHSTLEAETRVQADVATESNVRRSRPLRRSFFVTPPAGVEVEDILETFRRRYFNEASPTGDPRIDEERSRRRFIGSPQSSRSRVENTVARPTVENLNSLPADVSINMDDQGDSRPKSASFYCESPTAGASISDLEDSKSKLAEDTDSTSAVATETCVKDNTSEPARLVDSPTAMATGSVSDLNMSSRPTTQSLDEVAISEPVRRLFSPPHLAEILPCESNRIIEQEPSSVTMSSWPTSESLSEMAEPVRRLFPPPHLAEILPHERHRVIEQEPSSVTISSWPTSESLSEMAISEPVRRLFPPHLAEILTRDRNQEIEQEPSSVTMSSRPASESFTEMPISERVRRLFPEDLVELLARDTNQESDQEPSSDAYLSGSPERLRRVVRQKRPATTANTLLRDVLQEASPSGSAAEDTNRLHTPFRNNVEEIIADQASTSQNFSQRRFRATSKICDIIRLRMQQPAPEDTDSDDELSI